MKYYTEALYHPVFKIISESASALGVDSYVIGGFVRDYLLQRNIPKDIDVVAIGSGIDLAQRVASKLSGKPKVQVFKNFGTAMIKTADLEIEFVGARKESYDRSSRKPAIEDGTLEDDQLRRDFTVNAMAFSLNKRNFGELLDPFSGITDLKTKTLRTPADSDITFSDDPLRMMRAVRFASQLHFEINTEAFQAIKRNAERIRIVSKERIVDELNKILLTEKPSVGFLLMYDAGLLPIILPELTALQGIEEIEGQRHKDNFFHTLEVVDNIARNTDDLWLRWSALLHDIGKAPTKKFQEPIGWTFHGHEFVGSKMVYKLFKRMCLPLNEKMKFVQKMVLLSSRPIVLSQDTVTDSAVRRLIFDTGEDIESLMTLCEADITTKNPNRFKKYHQNFKSVRQKIEEVETRDHVRNFQPPVSGELIMETFGISPSKEIGIIKDAIKEAILEGIISNDYEAAYQYMLKKGIELGLKKS
ncbi:MAG: tRNA nucleotidyltransferase [Flavobacteriales bacterium CG_4_9_14_3_um_filter_40_17]|nr:MAG: tRNA nucleotidyltransferase [Flavobacteriales bacterium CG_4_9_14_3_um_filter_40_17]